MAHQRALELPGASPEVHLIEAGPDELDESALREVARGLELPGHVSRSYRYPFALVAGHDLPVGVDIERIEPLGARFLESILTPNERLSLDVSPDAHSVSSLWCSKEALAKALGDAVRYDPRRLESPLAWPQGSSGPWRARALDAPAGHVAWLCWRSG